MKKRKRVSSRRRKPAKAPAPGVASLEALQIQGPLRLHRRLQVGELLRHGPIPKTRPTRPDPVGLVEGTCWLGNGNTKQDDVFFFGGQPILTHRSSEQVRLPLPPYKEASLGGGGLEGLSLIQVQISAGGLREGLVEQAQSNATV